jgi:hypothetical protein
MNASLKPGVALLAAFTTCAVLSACTAPEVKEAPNLVGDSYSQSVAVEGVAGGVEQEISSLTATVKTIDYTNRKATLVDTRGNQKTLQFGPEAVNFDQVKVGDVVKVDTIEELTVYLSEEGAPAAGGEASFAARAPKGEKPLVVMGDAAGTTATIVAVDQTAHTATLRFVDGSERTVEVRPDVDVNSSRLGKTVVFRTRAALILSVETPAKSAQ